MNPNDRVGIHLSDAVSRVAATMCEITLRVNGSNGRHGSGTIWRPPGLIITNAHVADSQVHDVDFADGTRAPAWLVARDCEIDLAALAVSIPIRRYSTIRSACSLRTGEMVLALGNPIDGHGSITTGIVHRAVGKSPWIFSDIRLAPGNSGGPLAESTGAVIGINSMIVGSLGCAITAEAVEGFLTRFHLAEAA